MGRLVAGEISGGVGVYATTAARDRHAAKSVNGLHGLLMVVCWFCTVAVERVVEEEEYSSKALYDLWMIWYQVRRHGTSCRMMKIVVRKHNGGRKGRWR